MPKERDDLSGRYILRPRVFCSSGMGQVSTMSNLYTKRARVSLGCSPVRQLATWMEQEECDNKYLYTGGKMQFVYVYELIPKY